MHLVLHVQIYVPSLCTYSPLNLLSTSHYRLVYAVIFGLMSNDFLYLAISGPNVCGSGFNLENTFCETGMGTCI